MKPVSHWSGASRQINSYSRLIKPEFDSMSSTSLGSVSGTGGGKEALLLLSRTDADIYLAVNAWCMDPIAATAEYVIL